MAGPIVYDLTPMTKAGESRRTVFFTFDVPLYIVVTTVILCLPALLVTAILWVAIGEYAIIAMPLSVAAGLYLIINRSKKGMRTKTWQALLDARVNRNNTFIISGEPIDLNKSKVIYVVPSSVAI
ncbi:MAG: hypothetical protein ACYCU8_01015 [Ferrimicrobium acidiphilum]